MGSTCSSGDTLINGVCYGKCPDGYTQSTTGQCIMDCPPRFTRNDRVCERNGPVTYDRGIGYSTNQECISASSRQCTACQGRWYPLCIDGYAPSDCQTCKMKCPDGSTNDVCDAVIITPTTSEPSFSWTELIVVIVVIFIFVMAIIGLFSGNSDSIVDTIMGNPENDAYSRLQDLTRGRKGPNLVHIEGRG